MAEVPGSGGLNVAPGQDDALPVRPGIGHRRCVAEALGDAETHLTLRWWRRYLEARGGRRRRGGADGRGGRRRRDLGRRRRVGWCRRWGEGVHRGGRWGGG